MGIENGMITELTELELKPIPLSGILPQEQ